MQTSYAQKNETTQRAADNTAAAVHDNSPQSESLQRHASLANAAVQRAENPPRPNNTGLPDDLKNGIESLSGYSLDNVRVHYNSPKPATVQALAYTQGTDIHVAPGQEHALPHEAWHVAQQMAGRVVPTTNINGMPVNDNAALEHEADVMGEKALQRQCFVSPLNRRNGTIECMKSVQMRQDFLVFSRRTENLTDPGPNPQYNGTSMSWNVLFNASVPELGDLLNDPEIRITVVIDTNANDAIFLMWKNNIESKLNDKFVVSDGKTRMPLKFEIKKKIGVELAHQKVTVNMGQGRGLNGTINMNMWGATDGVDVTHEFGHMLGAKDEYGVVDGHDFGEGRRENAGVMNNPSEDFLTQHFEYLLSKIQNKHPLPNYRIENVR
ncbi:uncharacterized protein DUF4157 [Fibrobacter sp. UWR4]|nr:MULTISPECIES: DUF4157 domain-containing protein [unclassified Fibrobacter]PWJ59138.1 uncharacterized protein DUF4157 [Fibrobacter sp. UWR4]PZW63434.1 uncharacterized protein DUF4157 [Fibrobacter sp. UWR1]